MFNFEETFYEEDQHLVLDPAELSEEDLEEINEFLSDYDRTELIEEFVIAKHSNRRIEY